MKYFLSILTGASLLIIACQSEKKNSPHSHEAKTEALADTVKKSIPKEEYAQIGGTHFMIKYHAPAVRSRTIWGGLVPFDEVWVTGAHSATSLEINKEIIVNGTKIPPGKYALFTIPGRERWTIIINKNWEQHLTDEYDPKDDLARIEVTPTLLASHQERLKYSVIHAGGSKASIDIRWEKLKVSLPVQLNQ